MLQIHANQNINHLSIEKKQGFCQYEKSSKAFIDYSETTDDVYENLEDYNPTKKRKVLIFFDYMSIKN